MVKKRLAGEKLPARKNQPVMDSDDLYAVQVKSSAVGRKVDLAGRDWDLAAKQAAATDAEVLAAQELMGVDPREAERTGVVRKMYTLGQHEPSGSTKETDVALTIPSPL